MGTGFDHTMLSDLGERLRAGRLRHPRFLGLRDDKPPEEVVRER